jgi:two-component system cell cycle sensor histidine kinase/response regulator CckA
LRAALSDLKDPGQQLKDLQERVRILSLENEILISELREAKQDLGLKVAERIREHSEAYCTLEQEMTERLSVRKALQESERRYRQLFDSMIDGFALHEIICNEDGKPSDYRFLEVNPAFERLTGLKAADLINRTVLEVMPGTEAHWIESYGSVALTGKSVHFENYSSELGKYYEVTAYRPAEGQFAVIFVDITDRKLTEQALIRSNELFSLFMRHSPVYTYIKEVTSSESRVVQASDNFSNMIGISGSEMVGKTMQELFPADLAAKITQDDWSIVQRGDVLHIDEDLNERHYTSIKFPIVYENETLVAGYTMDITERKQAEHEVLRSKQFSESIINSMPGIFYVFDSKGKFLRVNDKFLNVSGYALEEVLKMHPLDFFSADETKRVDERIAVVFEKGESSLEADFLSRHGKKTPYYFTGFRGMIDGNPLLIGMGIDITERRENERAVRDSEEKYRSLFEETQDIVFISTYDGSLIDINPAGVSRLGYSSKEELMHVPIHDIYADPDDRTQFLYLLDRDGYVSDFEATLLRSDRQKCHVSINATAIRDDFGAIALVRGIMRDVTEHRKLEDQLRQAQKMESVGTLAGGIAHDFNNILTAIIGYGHLTLRKMETDDPNRLNIEQMLEAADRAAHLTKDLLLFSRKQAIDRKLVNLNSVIKRLEKFLIRVIGEDITFHTMLHKADLPIFADAHQIEQVLMNLATNARDAMPKGGALTIATDQLRLDERFVRLHGYGRAGSYVVVTVSDTGEGMDEQTRQKIFEPFYTTKGVGKGTGLGLAVVYGIVRQHEGFIDVYTEPGIGTTFRIYLPVLASDMEEDKVTFADDKPVGGTETILLAEDNEAVRDLTVSVLREFGYTVIIAVDGEDAVNKYRENANSIQMLLFDLIMPRKSGKEAYDEIRKIKPDLKILFASGYSPDIVRDKMSLGNGTAIIFKPVSPMELLKKVRSVLDKDKSR